MSCPVVEYDTLSEARVHLKDLTDAAVAGVPSRFTRDDRSVALVDADRLRLVLARLVPRAEVVAEADGWSAFIAGVPVAADGATFDQAIREFCEALREYAEDWADHLRTAPNHRDNWALVELVGLSTDEQLADWITGKPQAAAAAGRV